MGNGSLGCRIDNAGVNREMASYRSHVDDLARSPLAHMQTRILTGIHGREQVALKDATDIIWIDLQCIIGIRPGSSAPNVSTGIVDQDIKMTQGCQRLRHEVLCLCRVGQVGGEKRGAATQGTDLLGHRWSRRSLSKLRRCALVHVVNDHIGSCLSQVQGVIATQSPARDGHERALPRQVDCWHNGSSQLLEDSLEYWARMFASSVCCTHWLN